jgi:hypothetical protein
VWFVEGPALLLLSPAGWWQADWVLEDWNWGATALPALYPPFWLLPGGAALAGLLALTIGIARASDLPAFCWDSLEHPAEWPHSSFRHFVAGGLYPAGWMRTAGDGRAAMNRNGQSRRRQHVSFQTIIVGHSPIRTRQLAAEGAVFFRPTLAVKFPLAIFTPAVADHLHQVSRLRESCFDHREIAAV